MKKQKNILGFTLIEIIVVIVIIGLLSTLSFTVLGNSRKKARDAKRKSDLNTIGRFVSLSCFKPAAGGSNYDLADLIAEISLTKPELKNYLKSLPKDPLSGSDLKSNYTYVVNDEGNKCLLYANLENENETITLTDLNSPTLSGGVGVLQGSTVGVNDTNIYFQISN